MRVETLSYLALDAIEGTTADKQNILGIHMDVFLVGMLATALWRHIDHGTLKKFEQSLLHTLATHVARDARVIALAGYFIYFINEYDAPLRSSHIEIGYLKQARQDAFHIFAHVSGFGEDGGIHNGERHIQQLGYRARQQGFARTGTSHHNDITLFYLHTRIIFWLLQSLIMIVDRNRQITFGFVLTDDILVQIFLDVFWLWNFLQFKVSIICMGIGISPKQTRRLNNLISLLGTIFANEPIQSRYQKFNFFLASSTEAAHFLRHLFLPC